MHVLLLFYLHAGELSHNRWGKGTDGTFACKNNICDQVRKACRRGIKETFKKFQCRESTGALNMLLLLFGTAALFLVKAQQLQRYVCQDSAHVDDSHKFLCT